MDQINLGVQSALSHSWHRHSDSWMPVRAITSLVNGIKACFGGYSVSALGCLTTKLMKEHPDAWFTDALHKPLSAYNINIPLACERSTCYVFNKIKQLHEIGRSLQVKLVFMQDGSIVPIPMYNSDNSWFPKNLNDEVCRSDHDKRAPGEKIVCRHFAWAYAKNVFGRGKDTFERINTPEKIQSTFADTSNFPYEAADYYQYGIFADGYYFLEGKFSEALAGLVKKYWNMSSGEEKNFYFRSRDDGAIDHAMALRLKKQDGCMKVIFYDPNATLMHRTILLSEPDLAAHIAGEDLQASFLSHGALINIDDGKKFPDECDTQCFGASPNVMSHHIPLAPGHYPEIVRWQMRAS
ncbi:ShET2/EspL2 family type III secretion system effector toxin [Endozoicomonas sp. 8E]|uniref:ShET2/EspL2 family type III secretion system effector toxin n=1 Tax=Endozoicomonas sp. 8E TaxID=3035692 RepID=UPI002938F782|nr:ShET2/EspL2 family type III secretion system effector toxin [Endozoicomonas sp. 8E]WOG26074.1 ShET2/EspL2 family type III secretion system effector toxin [Endozoicomonas sp. 8E]